MTNNKYELDQRLSKDSIDLLKLNKWSTYKFFGAGRLFGNKLNLADAKIPRQCTDQAEAFHTLYRNQASVRSNLLESIYTDLSRPEDLVVMLISKDYLPFFENWLLSCNRHRIDPRRQTLVFCLDPESSVSINKSGIKTLLLDPDVYTRAGNAQVYADSAFGLTMLYKTRLFWMH